MIKIMPGMDSAASALQAEKVRMEVISQNIANANTLRTEQGGPYQRQVVSFETYLDTKAGVNPSSPTQMVRVARIMADGRHNRAHSRASLYGAATDDGRTFGLLICRKIAGIEEALMREGNA